jgi:hypothetical protein
MPTKKRKRSVRETLGLKEEPSQAISGSTMASYHLLLARWRHCMRNLRCRCGEGQSKRVFAGIVFGIGMPN